MKKSKKSRLKRKLDLLLRDKILLKYPNCLVCGRQAIDAHHFFPKSSSLRLRFCCANLISLCRQCHFSHHTKGNPTIHATIIMKKGIDWYEDLLEKKSEIFKDTLENLRSIEEKLKGGEQ